MKEEPNFYSFSLTLFAFLSFIFVFVYNLYLGNSLDYSLLKASMMACFSFFPLKLLICFLERTQRQKPLQSFVPEEDKTHLNKK